MKADIHPDVREVTIRCACGAEYRTVSIREDVRVEVCSKCHPLYTGKKKVLDSGGQVERFRRKYGEFLDEEETESPAGEGEQEEAREPEVEEDED